MEFFKCTLYRFTVFDYIIINFCARIKINILYILYIVHIYICIHIWDKIKLKLLSDSAIKSIESFIAVNFSSILIIASVSSLSTIVYIYDINIWCIDIWYIMQNIYLTQHVYLMHFYSIILQWSLILFFHLVLNQVLLQCF